MRAGAADALAQMNPSPNDSVPALTILIENEIYAKGTAAAMRALGKIGSQAEVVAPQLVEIAAGRNQAVTRQSQDGVAKLKRLGLWRFLFHHEEFRAPWSYPRLDDPNPRTREITVTIQRRDAAITILQVSSNHLYVDVALATLRELRDDPVAGLGGDHLLYQLGRKTSEWVEERL